MKPAIPDRRRDARIPVTLDALINFRNGRSWVCTIRDFCAGGMFVQGDAGGLRLALDEGDDQAPLEIHFTVRGVGNTATQHHLTGIPVRRLDDALGVHFPGGMVKAALQALTAYSSLDLEGPDLLPDLQLPDDRAGQSDVTTIDAARARKIAAACVKPAVVAMGKLTDEFFALFEDELIGCEKRASSMAEREQFLRALKVLPNAAPKVRSQLTGRITEQLRKLQVASPLSVVDVVSDTAAADRLPEGKGLRRFSNVQLALVEKADFEQWLVVAETVTAIERRLEEEIFILRTWLGLLQPGWKNKEANPLCPFAIVHGLKQALLPLDFEEEVIKVAFTSFGRIAQSRLGAFYDKLISSLEKTGAFPSPRSMAGAHARQQTAPGVARIASSPGSSGGQQRPSAPESVAPNGTGAGDFSESRAAISATGTEVDIEEVRAGLARIFQMARQTTDLSAAGDAAKVDRPVVSSEMVIKALSEIQRLGSDSGTTHQEAGLRKLLVDQLAASGNSGALLPPRTESSLDMVDSLVRAVQQDEVLPEPVRELVQRLELTFGKEAIRSGGLLTGTADKHSALKILDQLENIDVSVTAGDGKQAETRDRVSTILNRLIAEWDDNTNAFEDASRQLDPIVERQRKAYQRNLDRLVRVSEGRALLRRAKQVVLRRMIEMLEGRSVAASLLEIINPSWRNLLVNTALRQGTRSIEWKQQLQVIYRLVNRLDPAGSAKPANVSHDGSAEMLIRSLIEGLTTMGASPLAAVMDRLRAVLSGNLEEDEFITIEPGQVVGLFGWEDVVRSQDPMPPTGSDKDRKRWLDCLGRARAIQPGARVKFLDPDGNEQVLALAWVDPACDQFIFVNQRGLQDRDIALRELTDSLHGGRARLLEDHDAPLVERVSDRMVQGVHSRISDQAQRDELTSLVNRKAYERSLDRLLDMSRHGESTHCVLQIDLDGFRTLNSAFGIDGGDRLLRRVSRLLEDVLEGQEVILGRVGADEFGVVLYRTSVGEGFDVAERIATAIRELDFSWQDRQSRVSATVGVLGVNSASESAHQIFRNLESACQSGKQLGGDRVCLYAEDDKEMQAQRAVMHLATQVETWLSEGRVQLTVQQIAPAEARAGLKGHYEVLITVRDDSGAVQSPLQFIEAAERHGRMPIVDRFVVSQALGWIGRNPQALEEMAGLSINLSGQSMNQEDFLGFVLNEFEKSGAQPDKVCFEITETAAIGNMFRATEFMQKIKVMGCRFSLDDFGSGMSSYGYLRRLPVDYLKIDGSFIRNMVTDENDRAVVRSINEIGHFLGKRTVAEYVHDDATLQLAREMGIDYLQGWGIGKPMPIDDLLHSDMAVRKAVSIVH